MSEEARWNEILDSFNVHYAIALSTLTAITQVYVAVKTRLKLERPMIVISVSYMVSFLIRINIIGDDLTRVLLFATATLIQWAILYVFVFQMLRFRILLESDSPADFPTKDKKLNTLKVVVAGVYVVQIVSDYTMIVLNFYNTGTLTKDIFCGLRAATKLATDIYLLWSFYTSLCFFVDLKK